MKTVVDPRRGDIEDDASSTKRRSLLSLVGSLLGEISLPRLAMAWTLLLAVPGLILGFAPIAASAWIGMASRRMMSAYAVICILLLVVVVAVGWFGGRGLFRLAESSFWSLHSLAVQPGYAACREGLRHLAERMLSPRATAAQLAGLRAAATVAAGLLLCSLAALVLMIAWPSSRWTAGISDFASPHRLAIMVLANCVVLVAGYLAAATLVWTIADATMAQPRDLDEFHVLSGGGRTWRIAHLSDIHVVGERYGFRIESGRSGPRGNERLRQALKQLEVLDANDPLDAILITGDVTDAGRSAEWAEFLDALASHPQLAERVLGCRATTTSILSTVPIRRAFTSRQAPTGGCAGSGSCQPSARSRASVSVSWIRQAAAWAGVLPKHWSRTSLRWLHSPIPDGRIGQGR